jgi:hypothetical protein
MDVSVIDVVIVVVEDQARIDDLNPINESKIKLESTSI